MIFSKCIFLLAVYIFKVYDSDMRVTKAVINLENLTYNISQIRGKIGPDRKICMAVKADAYGHGACRIAERGLKEGAEYLGVAAVNEAAELRDYGIEAPILLFSLCSKDEIEDLIKYNITPFTASIDFLKEIEKVCSRKGIQKEVHLKIDTGMNRIGCKVEDSLETAQYISDSPYLILGGICTHFPVSDIPDRSFSEKQLENFRKAVENIKKHNIDPGIVHASNSGCIMQYEEAYFDMVRPGIILYGYSPDNSIKEKIKLKPVMSFESEILFIKKIKKGEAVSYGLTWEAVEDTWIGTIPAGYADGVNRLLSNKGKILINGRLYPIAGRVCMDQFMVDLGPEPACTINDRAVIFGYDEKSQGADDAAEICSTISYELLCNINKRVRRIYLD